jgi:hypothetical protein
MTHSATTRRQAPAPSRTIGDAHAAAGKPGGYLIPRSSSAGVVPNPRARRSRVPVVGSRRAFSILFMCERSTPLRRARITCEMPAASRRSRKFAAS